MGETSWTFLLMGSVAAVGAAMAIGTLAALIGYFRTGRIPGSDEKAEIPRSRLVGLWFRVAIGTVLAIVGFIAIDRAGIL